MVSNLFRIGNRIPDQRRRAMAQLNRHGGVLPERPATNLDRVVCRTPAALVPYSVGRGHAGAGVGACLHALLATPLAFGLLLHRDTVGDWSYPDRELHFPQLPGALSWVPAS